MIQVGDQLPAATLMEFHETEGGGCSLGPNPVDVVAASVGKTIALFALPGAFTPTCSAKHVPGYVANYEALKAAGVDEIWCISVNDAFVMGAWARDQKTQGKLRMLADGSAPGGQTRERRIRNRRFNGQRRVAGRLGTQPCPWSRPKTQNHAPQAR